ILSTDLRGISVWDAATGRRLGQIGGDSKTRWVGPSLSADGKRLAAREYHAHALHVWDVNSGARVQRLVLDGSAVLSPDGTLVASCTKGTIRLGDVASGRELRTWDADAPAVYRFAFSPHGTAPSTSGRDKSIPSWDVA